MKNRIKLVLVIADSKVGGGTNHVLGLLENLDNEKFETHLVCPKGYLANSAKKINKVEVKTIPMASKFDFVSLLALKGYFEQVQAGGNPFGPLIIHSHGPRAGFFTGQVAPKAAIRVYTEHIYDENYHLKNRLNDLLQRRFLQSVYARNDLLIAVSSSVEKFLKKISPKANVVLVPNAINISSDQAAILGKRKIKENNKMPIIGAIGSLNKEKGHRYLLDAMKIVIKKYPLSTLEIIGDGPLKSELKDQITYRKLDHNATIFSSKVDKSKYMKNWDVFALPSVSETFGIVVLEAMVAGIPVVASNVGGIPDIIDTGKNGLLVQKANPEVLAQAIIRIIEHPAEAAKFKRAGFDRAKDFDWKKIVKKIEAIYLGLVG